MNAFTYDLNRQAIVSETGAIALTARQDDGTTYNLTVGSGNSARLVPSAVFENDGVRLEGAVYNDRRYKNGSPIRTSEITHFVLDNNTQVSTRADAIIKLYPAEQKIFALDLEATGFRSGSNYYSLGASTIYERFKPVSANITNKALVLVGVVQSGHTEKLARLVVDEFQFQNGVTIVPDVDRPIKRSDNILTWAGRSCMAFNA